MTGPAGQLGPSSHDHAILRRHDVEPLALIGADLVHGLAAAGADRAFGCDGFDNARQVLRRRAAVGPPFGGAFAVLGGARFIFLGLDPGNRLFDVLKCEFKLIRIELFGPERPYWALRATRSKCSSFSQRAMAASRSAISSRTKARKPSKSVGRLRATIKVRLSVNQGETAPCAV